MRLQHGRENDAVEDDVVLANEMYKARLGILPPLLPRAQLGMRIAKFLRVGDITDGGIKPDVEHLTLCPFDGHGNTPIEVTCDSTGMQTAVEPRFALSIDIGAPFFVFLQNPLFEPSLVLV